MYILIEDFVLNCLLVYMSNTVLSINSELNMEVNITLIKVWETKMITVLWPEHYEET